MTLTQTRKPSRQSLCRARGIAPEGRLPSIPMIAMVIVLTSLAGSASAQELLNPGLDSDLSGWDTRVYHSWSPEDCQGSAASGSHPATKAYASSSLLTATQCVEVTPGEQLSLDVSYLIPATNEDAEIWISIACYAQPGCGDLIDFSQTGPFVVKGSWAAARVPPFESPAGTVACQVYLGVIEAVDDVVPVAAHFDNPLLDAALFADGFGLIDPGPRGTTSRFSLSGEVHAGSGTSLTSLSAYAIRYDFDLISDFTCFLDDPENGDQFEQEDQRWIYGVSLKHRWSGHLGTLHADNAVGLDVRYDDIAFYYASRLSGEPTEGVEGIHFHPMERPSVRLSLVWRY